MHACTFGTCTLALRASALLTAQLPSVRLRHMDDLHAAEHQRSSRAFGACFTSPSLLHESAGEPCAHNIRVRALCSVPCRFYQREMKTREGRAGRVPKLPLWALRPKMALEAPRDKLLRQLWARGAAQLQRLTFSGATSDSYFWDKGESVAARGCEQIRGRSCLMNTVDKRRKESGTTPR